MNQHRHIIRFTERAEAEAFCKAEHEAGNLTAFVSTLNSHMMTSDPSPVVVNAGYRPKQ